MIFQDAPNETIELTASLAGSLHWTCSTAEIVAGNGEPVPGAHGVLTTTGPATLSAAPAASEHRQVGFISVYNNAAVSNRATVRKMVGGVPHIMHSAMLAPTEVLQYTVAHGFEVLRDNTQPSVKPAVSNATPLVAKASLATQVAGQYAAMWRATAIPAQGAVPAAAANCNAATLGAMPLPVRTGAQKRLLTGVKLAASALGTGMVVEDRLQHMGGLNGTVATAQTVGVDVSVVTDNMVERIGAPDYSDVEWWAEWYTATGATIVTPAFAVTHGDGTTGTGHIFNAGTQAYPASVAASRRYQITADSGKPIKSVQSVTQLTTGTAGSFGVTASRRHATVVGIVANRVEPIDIPLEKAAVIPDSACLTFSALCATTSTGTLQGNLEFTVVEP